MTTPRRRTKAGTRYRLVLTIGEGEDEIEVYSERDICADDHEAHGVAFTLRDRLRTHIERWDPTTRTYKRVD